MRKGCKSQHWQVRGADAIRPGIGCHPLPDAHPPPRPFRRRCWRAQGFAACPRRASRQTAPTATPPQAAAVSVPRRGWTLRRRSQRQSHTPRRHEHLQQATSGLTTGSLPSRLHACAHAFRRLRFRTCSIHSIACSVRASDCMHAQTRHNKLRPVHTRDVHARTDERVSNTVLVPAPRDVSSWHARTCRSATDI